MMYPKVRLNHLKVKFMCLAHFKATLERWESYRDDKVAQREYWLLFTDELSRDGLITQHQRDTWICPF